MKGKSILIGCSLLYVSINVNIDVETNVNINDVVGRCKKITPSTLH